MKTELQSQIIKSDSELLCQICKLSEPINCKLCNGDFYCKDQYDFHFYTRHEAQ